MARKRSFYAARSIRGGRPCGPAAHEDSSETEHRYSYPHCLTLTPASSDRLPRPSGASAAGMISRAHAAALRRNQDQNGKLNRYCISLCRSSSEPVRAAAWPFLRHRGLRAPQDCAERCRAIGTQPRARLQARATASSTSVRLPRRRGLRRGWWRRRLSRGWRIAGPRRSACSRRQDFYSARHVHHGRLLGLEV
jgi:hypothetical protein